MFIVIAALALYMTALFAVSIVTRNNGYADVGYGGAGVVVVVSTLLTSTSVSLFAVAMVCMVVLWASRLSLRIYQKNRGKPEDFRYRAWREAWGRTFFVRSFFQIYMLQGLVAFMVVTPVTLALWFPAESPLPLLFAAGFCMWLAGFVFEVIADYQLDAFIHNPQNAGQIMTSGLWKYSRHPNYFGESLMWWGMATMAESVTMVPLLAYLSPVLITYLLLKVSGVPLLEKRWEGNPAWEAYKAKTSVFVPLPPRS